MQISNSVSDKYYTPYRTNTSVKAISGFSLNTDGKVEVQEADENWQGFAEFVDYQEFHKAWMSQGATTAFSYTENKGFNAEENSISLVPGMMVRLANGFKLSIDEYMVQALGDFRNNEAAKESTSIASAVSSLIKVANGQIPLNLFHSSRTQNNSEYAKKGLEAFGIDTSRTFIINEKAFHFDSDGQIRLGKNMNTYKNPNTPIFDTESLTKTNGKVEEDRIELDYDEKAFFSVGSNAPEGVKKAWMEAAKEVGSNGLGMLQNGMLGHISQMMVQRVVAWHYNETDCSDILGSTVESAIQATEQALHNLDNPLESNVKKSIEVQHLRMQERRFYTTFLDKLRNL